MLLGWIVHWYFPLQSKGVILLLNDLTCSLVEKTNEMIIHSTMVHQNWNVSKRIFWYAISYSLGRLLSKSRRSYLLSGSRSRCKSRWWAGRRICSGMRTGELGRCWTRPRSTGTQKVGRPVREHSNPLLKIFTSSLTRLGDFGKLLATNFVTKYHTYLATL